MTKQATAFFKAFFLASDEVPPVSHSTMVTCLQQVTTRSPKGSRGKEGELAVKMEKFWKEKSSNIYPEKVNTVGKSLIKANVANQMTNCLLVNATTHFQARCTRLCTVFGLNRMRAKICISNAFKGKWELVDLEVRETLQRVIPANPSKSCVAYDMKKRPYEYVLPNVQGNRTGLLFCSSDTEVHSWTLQGRHRNLCSDVFAVQRCNCCKEACSFRVAISGIQYWIEEK